MWAAPPCGGHSFTDWWSASGCGGAGSGNTGSSSVILDYDFTNGSAYGGYSDKDDAAAIDTAGQANGNTLTIANTGTVYRAFGGSARNTSDGAEANDNELFIDGGTVSIYAYGGYAEGKYSQASRNTVTISGGTVDSVRGGYVDDDYSTVADNTVSITGGTVTGTVYGGHHGDNRGVNTRNAVIISGGRVTGSVRGGYSSDKTSATDNTVSISGGSVTGDVFGGYAARRNYDATGNTITLAGRKV